MEKKTISVRKRQEISSASKMMFIWVALASALVGFAAVLGFFLLQKISYGEKVLAEKQKTADILTNNNKIADSLGQNIAVLETNEALKSTRLKESDRAIQSVLDALPAEANSTALGSSLQSKLLSGVAGVSLDAIKVDPVVGVETTTTTDSDAAPGTINFSFAVSVAGSNYDALREVLLRLERSIRPIDITTMSVEQQGSRLVMAATGHAYYQPAKKLELQNKVVKP